MSKSAEWKAKRAELAPKRMQYAIEQLEKRGFKVTIIDDLTISFTYHCATILFYPYTGGAVGATIKQKTRGINALLEQLI